MDAETTITRHPDRPGEAAPATVEGAAFAPGDLVAGRFRVERWLGAGGMGEVVAAWSCLADPVRTARDRGRGEPRARRRALLARRAGTEKWLGRSRLLRARKAADGQRSV